MEKLLNGFNNGRDRTDGIGGNPPESFPILNSIFGKNGNLEILNEMNEYLIEKSNDKLKPKASE